jgi:proline iminopeptidase
LEPSLLRNFDRDGFRIITLDQCAGRSTPAASIEGNATQSLRDGIARIREQLGIRRWPIAGLPSSRPPANRKT